MKKSQADRSVIAARLASQEKVSRNRPTRSVGTDPSARPSTALPSGTGYVKRTKAARLTATQRDSTGRMSAWSASPYFFTCPAWSQTVSNQRGSK